MTADLNKPVTTDQYTQILADIRDMQAALAKMNHTSTANLPPGVIQWSDTNSRYEKWNGFAWVALMPDASTTTKGLAQLSTSTTSASTTLAATASAVKSVKDSVNALGFTNIAGQAAAGQVPNLQNLSGACTAGQVPDIGDLDGEIADLYSAPISGHIRAGNFCFANGVAAGQTLSLSWLDGTQRTVGKTGSGADQIWAYLSNLPANAKAIICRVELQGVNTTSGHDVSLACHFGHGTGTLDGSASYAASCYIKDGESNISLSTVIIPLNTSQVFKYFTQDFDDLPALPGFGTATLFYQGYLTD